MAIEIMGQATNCACGTSLDDIRHFINSKGQDVCGDCFCIEMDEEKGNIKEINDKEEFLAAVKELNLGVCFTLAGKLISKIGKEKNSSKTNIARMAYLLANRSAQSGDLKSSAKYSFSALTILLDVKDK